MDQVESIDVFNTALEAGLRSVILLNEYYPKPIDFEGIVKLDYVLVYSKDFGGPESLHPSVPNRKGELAIRRELVRDGLGLMKRFGLIKILCESEGIFYSVSGDAEPFIKLMKSEYSMTLKNNAEWCVAQLNQSSFQYFNRIFMDVAF
ncbi:MAG: hypothetical protein ACI9YH_001757 [Colwellia sp.]|jgi:hypothetical protein